MNGSQATLKIDGVTREDDGLYYCRAILYGSVAESAVELRVDGKL